MLTLARLTGGMAVLLVERLKDGRVERLKGWLSVAECRLVLLVVFTRQSAKGYAPRSASETNAGGPPSPAAAFPRIRWSRSGIESSSPASRSFFVAAMSALLGVRSPDVVVELAEGGLALEPHLAGVVLAGGDALELLQRDIDAGKVDGHGGGLKGWRVGGLEGWRVLGFKGYCQVVLLSFRVRLSWLRRGAGFLRG